MRVAGFVLAGGRSTRMGRDKALLPWGAGTLLEHIAGVVRETLGNVAVIGREIPDLIPDCGPLGGLLTALQNTDADRVLIVACDMPHLTPELLRDLGRGDADAMVAETDGRLHPLCASYHRRVLPLVEALVVQRSLKMHDFLSQIQVQRVPADAKLLKNLNTPEDLPQ
jgi:hypothetical protein